MGYSTLLTPGIYSRCSTPRPFDIGSHAMQDLVIFMVPTEQDIKLVRTILETFTSASGLHTNVAKC
jgi:hypothetical protein